VAQASRHATAPLTRSVSTTWGGTGMGEHGAICRFDIGALGSSKEHKQDFATLFRKAERPRASDD